MNKFLQLILIERETNSHSFGQQPPRRMFVMRLHNLCEIMSFSSPNLNLGLNLRALGDLDIDM